MHLRPPLGSLLLWLDPVILLACLLGVSTFCSAKMPPCPIFDGSTAYTQYCSSHSAVTSSPPSLNLYRECLQTLEDTC